MPERHKTPSLPLGWTETPLGQVADVVFSNVDKKSWSSEIPVRLCNYLDVYQNDYLGDDHYYMEATASHAEIRKFALRPGDVLITKDSETPDDIGIPAVIESVVGPLVCGYHLALLRPGTNVNPVFLAKQIGHERIQRYFGKEANGITRYGLSTASVTGSPLWLPPNPEQDSIAAILRTLDDAIRRAAQVIAKLQQMKQGLLHDLLTRGVDENGDLRPSPAEAPHLYTDSALGRVPLGWGTARLNAISTFITSGSRGWAAFYADVGPLFLRIANLTREHVNLRFDSAVFVRPPATSEGKRTAVQSGDLLISITADLGLIGVVPDGFGEAYVNQHIALVRLDGSKANSRWIAQYLAGNAGQAQFRKFNDMGAKAGLNLPTVGSLFVAVPSKREQDTLAVVIDSIDGRIELEKVFGEKLRAEKNGLLHDLLTGEVRVHIPAEVTA